MKVIIFSIFCVILMSVFAAPVSLPAYAGALADTEISSLNQVFVGKNFDPNLEVSARTRGQCTDFSVKHGAIRTGLKTIVQCQKWLN